MNIFIYFLPELFFFTSISIFFVTSIIFSLSTLLKFPNITINNIFLSIISLIYTFFLFLNTSVYYVDFSIISKNKSNLLTIELFIVLTIIILLTSITYNSKYHLNLPEYILFLLTALGTIIMFLNVINVLFIYILLELQNILVSIFICIKRYNRYSIEASIKYFILGSFSSLIFLYGFSLIYGCSGFLSLHDISICLEYMDQLENVLVIKTMYVSFICILIGLLFKIYSAPFHFWLSDIYEGAPTSVLIYISTIQLLFMVYFFLKIYYYLFFDWLTYKNIFIIFIAVLTLLLGSIGTLIQSKIRKLLSYSAITMNGYFLFTLVNNNIYLLETSLMYLFVYIVSILLFFIVLLNTFIKNKTLVSLNDFFNLSQLQSPISVLMTLLLFSLSGLPPFIGFISKLFWLKNFFIEYNLFIFLFVFIFMIVSFYYLRLIKNLYVNFKTLYSDLYYISEYNYISIVCISFLQIILFYFILNNSIIRDYLHLLTLDYILNVL